MTGTNYSLRFTTFKIHTPLQAISKGNMEGAKIHAENAIRQKNQALNYRRMSARIDAVAARVQTALTTKQVQLFVLILRCVFIIATVPTLQHPVSSLLLVPPVVRSYGPTSSACAILKYEFTKKLKTGFKTIKRYTWKINSGRFDKGV